MRPTLPLLATALALLAGCMSRQAGVAPSSSPMAAGRGEDPAGPFLLLVRLTDGTTLRAAPADPLLHVDPGFPMPPLAWDRITGITRDRDQLQLSLADGNTIGCRTGSLRISLRTALGPLEVPAAALQSVANRSHDPRYRLKDRMVAWLALDETEGTTVHNRADPLVRGHLLPDGRWTADGCHGGALAMDKAGVNGAAAFPYDTAFGTPLSSGSITMAAWVRVEMEDDASLAIAVRDGFVPHPAAQAPHAPGIPRIEPTGPYPVRYALIRDRGGNLRFTWGTESDWGARVGTFSHSPHGTGWIHLAVVADFWAGQCTFYTNGIPVQGERTHPPFTMRRISGYNGLTLGRLYESRSSPFRPSSPVESPFQGALDEVVVFDCALSSNEVVMLFHPLEDVAPVPAMTGTPRASPPRCRVEMADGSLFRGRCSLTGFTLIHPELGRISLPLDRIVAMTRGRRGASDRIEDRAGNVLLGRCEATPMLVDTAFGRFVLPWNEIVGIISDCATVPAADARASETLKGADR